MFVCREIQRRKVFKRSRTGKFLMHESGIARSGLPFEGSYETLSEDRCGRELTIIETFVNKLKTINTFYYSKSVL